MVDIVLECANIACARTGGPREMILKHELDRRLPGQRDGAYYYEVWQCHNCGNAVALKIKRGEPTAESG